MRFSNPPVEFAERMLRAVEWLVEGPIGREGAWAIVSACENRAYSTKTEKRVIAKWGGGGLLWS